MGNRAPRYNNAIGADSECPICGMTFFKQYTHGFVNGHIDQCMANPVKAKEEQKRRKIEKELNTQGSGVNILIQRDDFGEQKITTVKESTTLTVDHVKRIHEMNETEIRQESTRDKIIWFNNKIDQNTQDFTSGYNEITINRENLIQDSLKQFLDIKDLRKEMKITFTNELSKDAGGLSREFFATLMKELLNQNLGLFTVANTSEFSYRINDDSKYIDNCLTLFYFFGKIMGKALFDRIPLNLCLNKTIFKALVGETTENDYKNLDEFKNIDFNVYNSLKFFRDQDLDQFTDVIEQYFTTDVHTNFGDNNMGSGTNTIDLIPGGSLIRVTNDNKEDFIKKKCYFMGYLSVQEQLDSITEGFFKVIPRNWVSVFNTDELEAALCGNPRIDLQDWKNNTEIKGFHKWSSTVSRFWQVMETYNQVELANVLQFCTGTSRVPLGGFRCLESNRGEKAKFCLQKVSYTPFKGAMGNLPRAHTCFNRLDLPRYPTYGHLKEAVDYIAKNEIRGFGLEE